MKIGILALQGDVEKHEQILTQLGLETVRIRYPQELDGIEGLILPGGESTTMTKLINQNAMRIPLNAFSGSYPILGTCAGMIMMAKSVDDARVEPLGILDIDAARNAYGRQIFSFTDKIDVSFENNSPVFATFIRAPKLTRIGKNVEVIATYKDEPVGVCDNKHLALSYHPELDGYTGFHEYTFLHRN